MATTGLNASGVQYVRDHLARIPRPDREARQAIATWLRDQGVPLDPDQLDVVTLHLYPHRVGHYRAHVIQRVSLTQAVLINWQGESSNDVFGDLLGAPWAGRLPTNGYIELASADEHRSPPRTGYQVFNGLFRRTEPVRYDHETLIDVRAEALQSYLQTLDFHTRFKTSLDKYWQLHLNEHRLSCMINFVAACNKQVAEGSLSANARTLVWRAAGLMPRGNGLHLSPLSIYGYTSTDLLCLNQADSDLTVLYVPGNSSPLLEFASLDLLKDWFGTQCKDAVRRQRLKQHFRLADAPQGIDFSGLDTALEGLAAYPERHALPPEHGFFNDDGTWPPRTYVNYRPDTYSPRIEGDLFLALAKRQRQRSYDDAEFLITSDGEIRKQRWRHYLDNTLNLLLPMSFVVPGLAPLLAAGGIVQLGLGLDEAINGKTLQTQLDGIGDITYGLFNALPVAGQLIGKANEALYQTWREGFIVPTRLNGRPGYPLSPINPPNLPDLDVSRFFNNVTQIRALPEADLQVAGSVHRYPRYNGCQDLLRGYYKPHPEYVVELDLIYDMASDLFIPEHAFNEVAPPRYAPERGTGTLRVVPPGPRTASHAMRMATLRALGVDLPLPVEFPSSRPAGVQPIPKQITSVWVGNKLIEDKILLNLGRNARTLTHSAYRYRLMLSNRDPAVFAQNLQRLATHAPGLQVLKLEEQVFYQAFEQRPGFGQYMAAIDGSGGIASNYASAADVLRYPMLYSEGGLYMDIDDLLLQRPDLSEGAPPAAALDSVELVTTADGLLLHPPMHNELMGMNSMFNNSMIGSHAANPTLLKISEEMHARYLRVPEPYPVRPSPSEDPVGFRRFARQVSWLSGPALLTDVVDQALPDLYRLRQLTNLYMLPRLHSHGFIDFDRLEPIRQARLPLMRVAKVGNLHSWIHD